MPPQLLSDTIISILTESPADQYEIQRKISSAGTAEISKVMATLMESKVIYVANYRKSERFGTDIPVYALGPPKKTVRPDLHPILAGVTSERTVEYDFVSRNLISRDQSAMILDIGSAGSYLAAQLREFSQGKWQVLSIDLTADRRWGAIMDARYLGFRNRVFDQILCISTVEHVGLTPTDPQNSDKLVMQEIWRVLKQDGTVILTVPYASVNIESRSPIRIKRATMETRVYDKRSLQVLVNDFDIQSAEFYCYRQSRWLKCSQAAADSSGVHVYQGGKLELPLAFHSAACTCLLLSPKSKRRA